MAVQIFRFSGEHCDWTETDQQKSKKVLGGKGAALVLMAQAGMPVPPGFTIPTDMCSILAENAKAKDSLIDELMAGVMMNMAWLTEQFGFTPLVSVRSGAPVSMPGMMDTILNVGLTQSNFNEWMKRLGHRATADSQRRLIQMLGSTAYGVPMEVFEFQLAKHKKAVGADNDTDLTAEDLEFVSSQYLKAFFQNKGFDFPVNDAKEQLRAAIKAVFDSWMNPRAIEYRKLNKISEDMGTAVNVQAMVFGNMGDDSGTGVLFTRNPSTGENLLMGEFLQNAQGEDVVAGIRTPRPMNEMSGLGGGWVKIATEILDTSEKLEAMYKDMVDVEFTVQQGKLFLLQSRTGKRSARAAFKIASDLFQEGVIDQKTALSRLTKEQFKVVRRPMLDPSFKEEPHYVGLPACPGVVTGKPVFSAESAVNCKEPCILVTHETTPEDIAGMAAAVGILTQTGGATSHAAVVARAMDKTCITGCTDLDLSSPNWNAMKKVTIDGSTGNVWVGIDVPVIDSSDAPEVAFVMDWCMGELDALEGHAVDQGDAFAHAVQAAFWWGNADVAESVLDGIVEAGPAKLVLDLRCPRELMPACDMELLDCFGNKEPVFWPTLRDLLLARKDQLQGLKVVTDQEASGAQVLEAAGFTVIDAPRIIPADYAAFSVLAD